MIRLKCLECGLTTPYKGSEGEFCPRCLAREQRAVRLITCSDQPSPVSKGSSGRLSIHTSVADGCHTITLGGELDIGSVQMLDAALAEACEGGAKEVVLDMGGIEFMDSMGLNAILRGRTLCEQHRCAFSLTPAQRPVERVFEATNVLKRLSFRRPSTPVPNLQAPPRRLLDQQSVSPLVGIVLPAPSEGRLRGSTCLCFRPLTSAISMSTNPEGRLVHDRAFRGFFFVAFLVDRPASRRLGSARGRQIKLFADHGAVNLNLASPPTSQLNCAM